MNYSDFKTFVSDYLWRQNDADLMSAMDSIIKMANSELSRKLTVQAREVQTTSEAIAQDIELPSDFRHMLSLSTSTSPYVGEMSSTTKAHIIALRNESAGVLRPYYNVAKQDAYQFLSLAGPLSAENPITLEMTYRTEIPDFSTTDTSWVADDYLDLYLYTVMKHCAIFLREEERIQVYAGYMQDALNSAINEDNHEVRFGGSPLKMQFAHHVPQTRRR